jgi:hypothetical protein
MILGLPCHCKALESWYFYSKLQGLQGVLENCFDL